MAKRLHLPLFPLNSVLFPGGVLPLRIFEPRYMEMVSVCMKEQSGFGVSLILRGKEVGEAATTYEVGTLVNIIDWAQRDDGLLGITVQGQRRYRIPATLVRSSQLVMAVVELLDEAVAVPLSPRLERAVQLLRDLFERRGGSQAEQASHYEDAVWV